MTEKREVKIWENVTEYYEDVTNKLLTKEDVTKGDYYVIVKNMTYKKKDEITMLRIMKCYCRKKNQLSLFS